MSGDAPAPASGAPPIDYNAIIQQIMQGGGAIQGPAAPATPAVNTNLPIPSLLGEALGGGVSPLYPMSEAQQTQAGNAALLNFGINMLQNSSGPVRHSLGQAIASGLLGAQGSLAGVREGQAQMLDVQNKQQTMQIERLKAVLPLLQLQQFGAARDLALGNKPTGTGLAATGAPISAGDAPVLQRDPSIKVAGDQANNPGNLMYARGQPGVSGQLPLSGGRTLAAFPDMPTGIAANANQLMLNQDQHGINTVRGMVSRWVGDPKADLGSYTADVSKALGVDPDAPVDFHNPDVLSKFIAAQRPHESGPAALNPADVTKGVGMALAARSAPPGAPKTATAPPAPTTPPAASTAPPGVQMGGAVPPPPGGAPGAAATPYQAAGAGIGRVLTDTTGKVGPQQVTVAPPPPNAVPIGKGTPIPAGKLLPKVADNVAAIQAGMQLGQIAPPVTALTAGPGAPTATATAAPVAPQPGWGSVVGSYGLPGQTQPATPPTVTPPAQPSQPATAPLTPPQPPGPARVPDTFTATRVPLPPDIQQRIDNPEIPPQYDTALHTALTPEALQTAQNNKAAAIVAAKKEAIAQGEAFQAKAADQQQDQWKVLRAEQQANDSAAATRQQEQDMEILRNKDAQINKLRDTAITGDTARLTGFQTDSDSAQNTINLIHILRNVESNLPASGDAFLNAHKDLIPVIKNLGVNEDQLRSLNGQEMYSSLVNALGTQLSQKVTAGAGTARQAEINQNMAALPTTAMDHDSRIQTLGFLQNLAEFQVKKNDAAQQYYYSTPHPTAALNLPNSLIGFDQKFRNDPNNVIIPRAPPNAPQSWFDQNVRPGMVFSAPVPRTDPKTNLVTRDAKGQPIYDYRNKVMQ